MGLHLKSLCAALAAMLLGGCATTNDAGVRLYKKPDLSKLVPGTPVNKVSGLKKPIKKEAFTKGDLKGAEAWLYEWDLPNDEVNNKMFTSVVVKDGIILGYAEESADKWSKAPELHKAAKAQSALEDYAGYMAQAAYYDMAAGMLANYAATRPRYDPVQASSTMFANSYQPWKNSGTVNYGMVGGITHTSHGNQNTSGDWFAGRPKRGTTSTLVGNTMWNSDGTTSTRSGNTVWHSDGTTSTRSGNTVWHSDGTTSTRSGNTVWHSDGTTSTRSGNTFWHQ